MAYSVRIEHFEGPLDLLLQLVESQEMEITKVSLLQVTEPYVQHVRENQGNIPPDELADFLVIAAKLVYLKSKALMPELHDPSLEEGPSLEEQLRLYKAFAAAAGKIDERVKAGTVSFSRNRRAIRQTEPVFVPPAGVTPETLHDLFMRIVKRLQPVLELPKAAIARAVTIEEKINQLADRVRAVLRVSFHRFLAEAEDRHEMVVSFLALLELVKQRVVTFEQPELFHEIHLSKTV